MKIFDFEKWGGPSLKSLLQYFFRGLFDCQEYNNHLTFLQFFFLRVKCHAIKIKLLLLENLARPIENTEIRTVKMIWTRKENFDCNLFLCGQLHWLSTVKQTLNFAFYLSLKLNRMKYGLLLKNRNYFQAGNSVGDQTIFFHSVESHKVKSLSF
jgi:hypothetical protein